MQMVEVTGIGLDVCWEKLGIYIGVMQYRMFEEISQNKENGCYLSLDSVADCSKERSRNPTPGIQLQAKEFDLMAAVGDLDEIEEVNAKCILMANLQQASTSGTQTDNALVYDSDGSAELHDTIYEKDKLRAQLFDKVSEQRDITKGVDNSANTRRPQPRSNTKNDRVPSASKSSCIKNKEVEVEEHHRNLLLSKNKKHMSSECNNVKLAIRNDKYEVICAMGKQCLITSNHDVCVLHYMNGMNSRNTKQHANVLNVANQKKHKTKVRKSKKLGYKERPASPMPSKPRSCLRNLKLLINFVWKFLGTVCFGNDYVAAILGYGDLQWGNILITRVYSVVGLGHNLFSVGQFYDLDLDVAFRRNTCFVKNLEGVNLLKGNRKTFTPSISIKWPLHLQFASWLVLLLPSHGYGINVYPTSTSTL
ncbi:hypothetical protein Tco_1120526 [Tanacetum coccineum]